MKGKEASSGAAVIYFFLVGVCIFAGVLCAFRFAGGSFAEGASLVSRLTISDARFVPSLKRAAVQDGVFCLAVLILASSPAGCVLPGLALLFDSFGIGAVAGLAAKSFVTKKALGMFFALFISNFLVLPLKVLLFMASVRFSFRLAELPRDERLREMGMFLLKILIFYILMIVSECVQLGIGTFVL